MRFLLAVLAVPVSLLHGAALANGFGESRAWQFDSTFDRAQKAAVQNLIELKRGGRYSNQYDIDYNIEGDYINCSLSATSIGNQGSVSQDAPMGSPSVNATPAISAATTGNSSDAAVSNESGGALRVLNRDLTDSVADGTYGNSGATSWNSSQSNSGSTLSSGVDASQISTSIGDLGGDGGASSAALNSTQSNTDSVVDASVSNSSACAFTRLTGTGSN